MLPGPNDQLSFESNDKVAGLFEIGIITNSKIGVVVFHSRVIIKFHRCVISSA